MNLLEYLNKNAQKAYKEILSIIEFPNFLFSNDPKLKLNESRYNYRYIHGFNRLIKKNRISEEVLINSLIFLEEKIEEYLCVHYHNKQFVLYINGDAVVPAFTLTVQSFYGESVNCISLQELVTWYKENACFNGLEFVEAEEELGTDSEETFPDSIRTYKRIIRT